MAHQSDASTTEWRQYWAEMETGCRRILRYIQPLDEASFTKDGKTVDAVLYNLQLVYEAAQSLPDDIHPRLAETHWRSLASFRELTSNAKFGQDARELWATVVQRVPALLEALRAVHQEAVEVKRTPQLHRRGRHAAHPVQIPPLGWRDIGWRVWDELYKNNLFIVSAGVAFYGLLAIFPALAALVSIYGLLANPADVESQLAILGGILPADAWAVLQTQLQKVSARSQTTLSLSVLLSLLVTLWSARAGIGALLTAMNIVYKEEEKRSLLRFYLTALLLTVGAICFGVVALALIVALPALLGRVGLGEETAVLVRWLRWPFLTVSIMFALAVIYRFGPSRHPPRWKWVSVGAVIATLLWLLGSGLFSFYVSNFNYYNETYGSVGAVIILMLWFWLTAFIVLMGAELNAEMEHQTKQDTTIGKPKPMGERNAYMADTLGRRP